MISIALVEPNPIQREGLLAILNREVDFLVVGVAKDPATVQITLDQHRPRILLIDFSSLLNDEKKIDKQWMRFAKDIQIIATNTQDTRFFCLK